MTPDQYLQNILTREAVDTGIFSPVLGVQTTLQPIISAWAGMQLRSVSPSGSFAKGTANHSGTDIDSLFHFITQRLIPQRNLRRLSKPSPSAGYTARRQNVSVSIRVNGYDVDLVPGKRQDAFSEDHSLYRRRADTWTKTNVQVHVAHIKSGGRLSESRIVKLWRKQKGLDFPSFYLELAVIQALSGQIFGSLSGTFGKCLSTCEIASRMRGLSTRQIPQRDLR